MRFPTPTQVANELRRINAMVETNGEGCDVRLQVFEDGWAVHWGDPSYDQDHSGFWGSGTIPGQPGDIDGLEIPFRAYVLAMDLLEQAKEQRALSTEEEMLGLDGESYRPPDKEKP